MQDTIGLFCKNISAKSSGRPVDDLKERDDAEAKAETKEPAEGGNEVHWTHSDAPLQLCEKISLNLEQFDLIVFGARQSLLVPFKCSSRVLDLKKEITVLTHDSVLPKEDVDNSHVLLPGVVVVVLEEERVIYKVQGFNHLWLCNQKAVLVSFSHRTGQGGDVGRS